MTPPCAWSSGKPPKPAISAAAIAAPCRSAPGTDRADDQRALDLIDEIAEVAKPVLVLSGGEPLFRPDLFDIAAYGVETGFRMALATNGTLVTERVAAKIADTGFSRVAISLDGAKAVTHDAFSGLPGSHSLAIRGIRQPARRGRLGPDQLDDRQAQRRRAAGDARPRAPARRRRAPPLHAGTGRVRSADCGLEMLPADEYERVLRWFDERSQTCPIDLKATCAPHYYRIRAQRIEQERRQGNFTSSFIAPGTKAKAAPTVARHGRRTSARPASLGDDPRLSGRDERLLRVERRRDLPVRLPAGERRRHAP